MRTAIKLPVIAVLCGALSLAFVTAANAGDGSGSAQPAAGSAAAPEAPAPTPADALANPIDDPIEAYSDLKAAKKQGWLAFGLAGWIMLVAGLARAATKWPTWPVLSKINQHKRALIVLGVLGAAAGGAYNALALGGSGFALLIAAGIAATTFISAAPSEAK